MIKFEADRRNNYMSIKRFTAKIKGKILVVTFYYKNCAYFGWDNDCDNQTMLTNVKSSRDAQKQALKLI